MKQEYTHTVNYSLKRAKDESWVADIDFAVDTFRIKAKGVVKFYPNTFNQQEAKKTVEEYLGEIICNAIKREGCI